jgi:hypothetical protein
MICKSNRLTLKCNDVSTTSYRANGSVDCCCCGFDEPAEFNGSLVPVVGAFG